MTVGELIEFLKQQDPDKEVTVWSREWGCNDPIESIELDDVDGTISIM